MKKYIYTLIFTCISFGHASSDIELHVCNPYRTLPQYLVWYRVMHRIEMPPTLKKIEGITAARLAFNISQLFSDAEDQAEVNDFVAAMDNINTYLVNKKDISPDDIRELHMWLIGGEEASPLRTGWICANRFRFNMTDVAGIRQLKEMTPDLVKSRLAESDNSAQEFRRMVDAFSCNGKLRADWLSHYEDTIKESGEPVDLKDFVERLQKKSSELGKHLFDTDLTDPSDLPDALSLLCDMINSSAELRADPACFDTVFKTAAEVFIAVIKHHIFNDANGRLAFLLANMVLVRAGLLPVISSTIFFDKLVRWGLDNVSHLTDAFRSYQSCLQEWYENVPEIAAEEVSAENLRKKGVLQLISEYERSKARRK